MGDGRPGLLTKLLYHLINFAFFAVVVGFLAVPFTNFLTAKLQKPVWVIPATAASFIIAYLMLYLATFYFPIIVTNRLARRTR